MDKRVADLAAWFDGVRPATGYVIFQWYLPVGVTIHRHAGGSDWKWRFYSLTGSSPNEDLSSRQAAERIVRAGLGMSPGWSATDPELHERLARMMPAQGH